MFDEDVIPRSFSRQAYQALREQIITLQRGPGALLDEAELMRSLKLGRTPIREAIQKLVCDGLVIVRPRHGTYVAGLDEGEFKQAFELRLLLESFAAGLAAERATADDIAALERALAPLAELPARASAQAYTEVDRAFHRALALSAHNRFLENSLGRMYLVSLRLWYFSLDKIGSVRDVIEQHRYVLQAISCRDGRAAQAAIRKHIRESQTRIRAALPLVS